MKELSICQSLLCLDLVSFPVLSQITLLPSTLLKERYLSKLWFLHKPPLGAPSQVGLDYILSEFSLSRKHTGLHASG
jgi:hypothetical protein